MLKLLDIVTLVNQGLRFLASPLQIVRFGGGY